MELGARQIGLEARLTNLETACAMRDRERGANQQQDAVHRQVPGIDITWISSERRSPDVSIGEYGWTSTVDNDATRM